MIIHGKAWNKGRKGVSELQKSILHFALFGKTRENFLFNFMPQSRSYAIWLQIFYGHMPKNKFFIEKAL